MQAEGVIMENSGWIIIHRKLLENPIAKKSDYMNLWIHLLLMANHKETSFIWNNKKETLKPGQLITGRKVLSEKTGIAESQIYKILNYLELEQQIEQQKTTKYTVITIVNWGKYQNKEQQKEQQSNNRVTTKEQQSNTYNNDNNVNNDNKKEDKYISTSLKILNGYNKVFKKNFKSTSVWYKNYVYWRKTYSDNEIATAIIKASKHPWWKDKLTLEKLFRTKNKNGECDYIGELLNS